MTMNQPPPMPVRQLNLVDESHLHLLSVFHFVMGGLYTLGIGFVALHFLMMRIFMTMPHSAPVTVPAGGSPTPPSAAMPPEIMTIMIVFYVLAAVMIASLATANILAGFWLRKRVRHSLTFVVAAINCAFFPFGTVLGVFTIIVLQRATVKMTYAANTRI
ncbi:MAG: hypothetical protein RLZZ505_3165 [Verrucomicrobiota bacterium]|jgi:hypothetical protein